MKFLQTHNLCKHFGGLKAVNDIDLELEQGQIRALIGPNGAGKTTLVSLLCGRLQASSGKIMFQNQDITQMPAYQRSRKGIAYTFQITSIYPALTVYENIAIACQNNLKAGEKLEDLVTHNANRTGLDQHLKSEAGNLAYGHQRILEVTMGLATSPKLLILDEPTQGLSNSEIQRFCKLVNDANQDTTILLIEHNMEVVMQLAHSITVMHFGEILAQGSVAQIQSDPKVQAAYLGHE